MTSFEYGAGCPENSQAAPPARTRTKRNRSRHEESVQAQASAFLAHLEQRRVSSHTLHAYKADLKQLLAWLDSRGLTAADLDRRTCRGYASELALGAAAPATIARKVTSMKAFVAFLAAAGVVDAEAASGIKTPPRAKALPDTISQEEARLLLAVAERDARRLLVEAGFPDDFRASFRAEFREQIQGENRAEIRLRVRNLALLELLYDCGLRSAEACGLRLEDVRRDDGMLIVHGKGSKTRMVPYLPATLEVIDLWLTARPECSDDHLLLTANCNPLDTSDVRRIVGAAGKRAGLSVHPHQLRHACATHLMEEGVDTRVVQEFLGHASIQTTQIYVHVSGAHMRDVYLRSHPRAERERA